MRHIVSRKNQSEFIRLAEIEIIGYYKLGQRVAVHACQRLPVASGIDNYVDTGSNPGVIDSDSDVMYARIPDVLHET
ncbi:hypothetical protein SUDANB37_03371 [Streptomyces sp. enrichment culture]